MMLILTVTVRIVTFKCVRVIYSASETETVCVNVCGKAYQSEFLQFKGNLHVYLCTLL